MIKNRSVLFLLLLCLFSLHARAQDTLWVKKLDGKAFVVHKAKNGEDVFLLSRKYSVPPAVLADVNNLSYQSGLTSGGTIWIPVDNYNFIRVESVTKSKPIYYKVGKGEALKDVTRMISVAQSTLQRWNHMSQQDIEPGQVLQIGWIAFDATQVPFSSKTNMASTTGSSTTAAATKPLQTAVSVASSHQSDTIIIKKPAAGIVKDTDTVNAYEQLYEDQVTGEPNNSENGAAVFYPLKLKLADGVYYALHNTAEKGTIIKVTNPANGNVIYAKVIGTIPKLADYNNCIIALSTNAAKGLMAKEKRMFCKIEYK